MPRRKSPEDVAFDAVVGRKIADARKAKGWTYGQLASRLDVTKQQLYWYETGRTACPLRVLRKASVALGVPLGKLLPIT